MHLVIANLIVIIHVHIQGMYALGEEWIYWSMCLYDTCSVTCCTKDVAIVTLQHLCMLWAQHS